VVVADLTRLSRQTMRPLIESHQAYGSAVVIIADERVEADLTALAAAGVTSILPAADATRSNLLAAIRRTADIEAAAPSRVRADLDDQLRSVRTGRTATAIRLGLSERETAVLQHLSEGLNTTEIMKAMNVSERTVKYILWGVMSRLSLRNRVHAVAFAIRAGIL
jgi:DNA-binding NarL/FixJ family response regulator